METLADLLGAIAALTIPALFGFALGREFPRQRKAEKVGREFLTQVRMIHQSAMFCGEGVKVTHKARVNIPGKPPLGMVLTTEPDA